MPEFKTSQPDTEPEVRPLDEIALELGEVYYIEKDAKDALGDYRTEFFEAVTATFADQDLAQKSVVVPDDLTTVDAATEYALRYNSGWRVLGDVEIGKPIILEEDPDLKPWDVVVPVEGGVTRTDKKGKTKVHPGYKVTKTIASGSALIDTERLEVIDPDLYEQVTEFQNWAVLSTFTTEAKLKKAGWPRVVRGNLEPEEVADLEEYTFEGPKQQRLNVTLAKEDEIGQG